MVKRLLCMLLAAGLLFAGLPAVAAEKFVILEDQYLTLIAGSSMSPKRVPGTLLRSFNGGDRNIASVTGSMSSTPSEYITGYQAGSTTMVMMEYDTENDVMYYTPVHVTVKPYQEIGRRTKITFADNPASVQKYIQPGEHPMMPVGTVVNMAYVDMDTGERLPCTFSSSNTAVATVDSTGKVTTHAPGYASIFAIIGENQSVCLTLYVYGESTDGIMNMIVYTDADALTMFKSSSLSSQVLIRIPNKTYLKLLTKGDTWSKVTYNGYTGYVQTRYLIDTDTLYPPYPNPTPTPVPNNGDGALGGAGETISEKDIMRLIRYTWRTDGKKIPLYAGSSTSSAVLGEYGSGIQIYAEATVGGWVYVTVEGKPGYMEAAWVANTQYGPDYAWNKDPNAVRYINAGSEGHVSLQAQPASAAQSYGMFPSGTKLVVLNGLDATWAYVSLENNHWGYMLKKYISDALPSQGENGGETSAGDAIAPGKAAYVQTGNDGKLNLRAKASASSAAVDRYPNGTAVSVISISRDWAYVQVNGRKGYMMKQYLTAQNPSVPTMPPATATPGNPAEGTPGETTMPPPTTTPAPTGAGAQGTWYVQTGNSGKLNLRTKASTASASLGRYLNGTAVTVLHEAGDWMQVRIGAKSGYVMKQYLSWENAAPSPTPSQTPAPDSQATASPAVSAAPATPSPGAGEGEGGTWYVQTGNDGRLNLRTKASAASSAIGRYPNGTAVSVISVSGDWAHVRVGSRTGYMMKQYLAAAAAPAPEKTAAPAQGDATPPPSAASGETRHVQTGNDGRLHLRAKASVSAVSRGLYENGTAVSILSVSGDWAYVRVGGKTGYMLLALLAAGAQ